MIIPGNRLTSADAGARHLRLPAVATPERLRSIAHLSRGAEEHLEEKLLSQCQTGNELPVVMG